MFLPSVHVLGERPSWLGPFSKSGEEISLCQEWLSSLHGGRHLPEELLGRIAGWSATFPLPKDEESEG